MESIKCSAEAVDIYIFLPACSVLEPQLQQQRLSPRSSMDIVWSPPSSGSSTHHFWALVPQGLQWLRAWDGSSRMNCIPGSTISLSTAPGGHSENSLFCMLAFIHFMGRYEKEQECSHCLNVLFISPASCFKKKTQIPTDRLVKLAQ